MVDWVLVELRDATDPAAATTATSIALQAAFLKKDGSITGTDGTIFLQFNNSFNHNLFVIVWHRNHLPVLSSNPLTNTDGLFTWDFTGSQVNTFGGLQGCSQLSNSKFGLIAGDANADGQIDLDDKNYEWLLQAGYQGYLKSDMDMDGQADNPDKNEFWIKNMDAYSQVPE